MKIESEVICVDDEMNTIKKSKFRNSENEMLRFTVEWLKVTQKLKDLQRAGYDLNIPIVLKEGRK